MKIANVLMKTVGSTRYARVMYRGQCLMTVNVRRQKTPCDWEDIENAEIEAYKLCREYALAHGFHGAKRIYEEEGGK